MKMMLIISIIITAFSISVSAQTDEPVICDEDFRLVVHVMGETCVPNHPQRIVPLDLTVFELLLLAEMPPVAFSDVILHTYQKMHPDLEETFVQFRGQFIDIGLPPNIEKILNVEPDLIIGSHDMFTEALYPHLSQIAPTVLYEPLREDWQTRFIIAGEALGFNQLVQAQLETYNARIDELHELLGDEAETITVSLVRTFPGQIGLVLTGTTAASVLQSVGLSRPESQQYDYQTVLDELDGRPELLISFEQLLLADADVVFVFGDTSELFDNPLWNSLPAVIDGRAYEVGYYWWGDGLLSAHKMLNDLFTYLIPQLEDE